MSSINLNSIFVIESIEDERKTGKELYEDRISKFGPLLDGFKSEYFSISNKKSFLKIFDRIVYLTNEENYKPIIHIECHGDESKRGFVLSPSQELVKWEELEEPLRKINIAMKNSLIISMGVCNGSELINTINLEKPAPFFGIITPKEKIYNTEIIEGFNVFYQSLLFDKDINKAIKLIKLNPKFALYGSEVLFSAFEAKFNNKLNTINLNLKESDYQNLIIEFKEEFNKNKQIFLMTDKFPEISERFLNPN